jgi:HEAT repeat protein
MALAGCGQSPPTMAHYKPVAHWVQVLQTGEPAARKQAVKVLGNVGAADPAAIPALARAVKDGEVEVRRQAVLGLLNMGPVAIQALPDLKKALDDPDAKVRAYAARAVDVIEGQK